MARIKWTERARGDLKEIVAFIARDSKMYARSFALSLRRKVGRLTRFPESGRRVPEDPAELYREVIVGKYRVIYRRDENAVVILAVIHGARDIGPLLP